MLGRIVNVIKGDDDFVRVNVKTESGVKCRAISQNSPLPIEESNREIIPPTAPEPPIASGLRKRPIANLLSTLLVLCLVAPVFSNNTTVKVEKFHNHPGLYFDGIGKINLVTNKWNFVAY